MKLDPEVPLLSPCLVFSIFDHGLCQVNLVNSEAVFLVNKAVEQFVQCLALEVMHLLGVHFRVLNNDFVTGKQLYGREENTSRQVTPFWLVINWVEVTGGSSF